MGRPIPVLLVRATLVALASRFEVWTEMAVGSLAPGKQVCVAKVVRVTECGTAAARFEECRFLLEA